MLLMSIALGLVAVLFAASVVCICKLNERLERAEQEKDMWKLAAEHWTQEAEKRSY
jgi:hypothetical protein